MLQRDRLRHRPHEHDRPPARRRGPPDRGRARPVPGARRRRRARAPDRDVARRWTPIIPPIEWEGGEVVALVDPERLRLVIEAFVESLVWWANEGPVRMSARRQEGRLVLEALPGRHRRSRRSRPNSCSDLARPAPVPGARSACSSRAASPRRRAGRPRRAWTGRSASCSTFRRSPTRRPEPSAPDPTVDSPGHGPRRGFAHPRRGAVVAVARCSPRPRRSRARGGQGRGPRPQGADRAGPELARVAPAGRPTRHRADERTRCSPRCARRSRPGAPSSSRRSEAELLEADRRRRHPAGPAASRRVAAPAHDRRGPRSSTSSRGWATASSRDPRSRTTGTTSRR